MSRIVISTIIHTLLAIISWYIISWLEINDLGRMIVASFIALCTIAIVGNLIMSRIDHEKLID